MPIRKATIEIRWVGPRKAMHEFIDERAATLFEELTCEVAGIEAANANVEFAVVEGRHR